MTKPREPEDSEVRRRRGIYEKSKSFEEEVAELFSLLGYRTFVDYKRDDMQFDIRMEITMGVPLHFLVECKDTDRSVTQKQVREFASKVDAAARVDRRAYQKILVARSAFANNAPVMAENLGVHLQTYKELLRSLVDLRPAIEDAIHAFKGTTLEGLYVEQEVVFEQDIKPGEQIERKGLTREVVRWLDEPSSTFLALLGDFGCGKTSFSKRLACELAFQARDEAAEGKMITRVPVVIDLKDGGSTTVTLESLLTHHFQRLSPLPFNPQALLQLNRQGHLVLVFDGFDETIVYTEPRRYVENLRQILRAAEGKAKVIMTCRTHYFRDRPEALRNLGIAPAVVSTQGATSLYEELQSRPGTLVGYLLEFQEKQIEAYLQKALPPTTDRQSFREQIRHTYNLENLAERPFLLEIIVKTLPRLQDHKGEVTLADLYESYCESWFKHTDFRLTLTRDYKVALVEHLARLVWDSPENRVHFKTLFERACDFVQFRQLTPPDKDRVDYEIRTALFLRRDNDGNYSFIHRSFLEFFVARTLRDGLAQGNVDCLGLKRITREVAFFLELWPQAQRIPEIAGRILEAPYQAGVSENALLLLYFHARAKLGPLVGPQSAVEPDLLEIRKAFSGVRPPKAFHLDGADLEGAILPGTDLSNARLEGARLGRADLRRASLDGAKLAKSDLGSVSFHHGSAQEADLSEASLDHLDGREASFRKATLRNADLSFARLSRADLREADVEGIQATGTALLGSLGTERLALPDSADVSIPNALDLRWQTGHLSGASSVAWSPDSRCIATGSYDGSVKIWDAGSGQVVGSFAGHGDAVKSVAWSPDGTRLASGSYDKTVKVWDSATGRVLNTLAGHDNWVNSVAWSPDRTRLASGSADETVKVWDAASGGLLSTLRGHDNSVFSVAWSPDGTRLASGSGDQTVKVWEAATGRVLNTLSGHDNSVLTVAWSPDGTRLASGSADKTVKVWEAATGRVLNTLSGHDNSVLTVAWSPDGTRLASGSSDRTVKVWEASTGRVVNTLSGHDNLVLSVAWSPDGTRLASGSSDRTVKVWDAATGRLLNPLTGHDNYAFSVSWSAEGTRLASGSSDKTVKVWDAATGHVLSTLRGHDNSVFSVAWSPDGTRLASGSSDRTVRIWDAAIGRLLNTFSHDNSVLTVAWSPDGTRLASGSEDQTVKIWDATTGCLRNTLAGHDNWVNSVSWSEDGTRLVSGAADQMVKVWDATTGRLLNTLTGHDNSVSTVAWSADGTRLVSGSRDSTLKIWDAATGRLLDTLSGQNNSVFTVAWSADGTRLASGTADRTVKIWDAATGRLLNSLTGHDSWVLAVAWSPDGTRLVVASSVFLHIWDLTTEEPRLLARFFSAPGGPAGVATPDGYVFGPPEALDWVRFGDGWALYDVTEVPERVSEERVLAALKRSES